MTENRRRRTGREARGRHESRGGAGSEAHDCCYTVGVLVAESIVVRPYEPADDHFIARLAHDAFDEYTPRAVQHTLDMARHFRTLVALRGERRVGFLTLSGRSGDVFVVQAIAVSRRERGRGIGHRLMQAFESLAAAEGARRLELCTADCNLAALDLFLKRGFRLTRRREGFYDRGQAACILVKER
jgi:[ribosomal protein S18]-alanine N-acetyltransferase